MIKKSLVVLSVACAYYLQAQDVSTIKNTVGIYSNTSLPGTSKYNAMAGSMGALGGDVSVLNSNPAGLGVMITNDLSGTLNVNSIKNTTTLGGASKDYTINKTDLGNIGGAISFQLDGNTPWKFVNLGVNYSNQSIEDYSETPKANISFTNATNTNTLTFQRHAYDRTGNQTRMSFGVGGNYDNRIFVGAGLNMHTADITQYDTAQFSASANNSIESYSKQYTPFTEKSNGFSANVGVIGKVTNQFRLGAALETPTWWVINRVYNYYNDISTGKDGTASEDRNFTSPMKATLSAAFVPNKNFAINVDYSLGLSKPQYKVYGGAETELNEFFNKNYKNLSEVKVGAEYRIEGFRVRGGYAMASNPLGTIGLSAYNDAGTGVNTSYSDLMASKRNTLGFGLGYDFKSFYLDAAFQNNVTSEYKNPFLYGVQSANVESAYYSNSYMFASNSYAVSNVKNTRNNISLTLGWKF